MLTSQHEDLLVLDMRFRDMRFREIRFRDMRFRDMRYSVQSVCKCFSHQPSETDTLKRKPCSRPPGKSGWRLVSLINHLLSVPVPSFTKIVPKRVYRYPVLPKLCPSACTGTQFYQLCLDQSEIPLDGGRETKLKHNATPACASPPCIAS